MNKIKLAQPLTQNQFPWEYNPSNSQKSSAINNDIRRRFRFLTESINNLSQHKKVKKQKRKKKLKNKNHQKNDFDYELQNLGSVNFRKNDQKKSIPIKHNRFTQSLQNKFQQILTLRKRNITLFSDTNQTQSSPSRLTKKSYNQLGKNSIFKIQQRIDQDNHFKQFILRKVHSEKKFKLSRKIVLPTLL